MRTSCLSSAYAASQPDTTPCPASPSDSRASFLRQRGVDETQDVMMSTPGATHPRWKRLGQDPGSSQSGRQGKCPEVWGRDTAQLPTDHLRKSDRCQSRKYPTVGGGWITEGLYILLEAWVYSLPSEHTEESISLLGITLLLRKGPKYKHRCDSPGKQKVGGVTP